MSHKVNLGFTAATVILRFYFVIAKYKVTQANLKV